MHVLFLVICRQRKLVNILAMQAACIGGVTLCCSQQHIVFPLQHWPCVCWRARQLALTESQQWHCLCGINWAKSSTHYRGTQQNCFSQQPKSDVQQLKPMPLLWLCLTGWPRPSTEDTVFLLHHICSMYAAGTVLLACLQFSSTPDAPFHTKHTLCHQLPLHARPTAQQYSMDPATLTHTDLTQNATASSEAARLPRPLCSRRQQQPAAYGSQLKPRCVWAIRAPLACNHAIDQHNHSTSIQPYTT